MIKEVNKVRIMKIAVIFFIFIFQVAALLAQDNAYTAAMGEVDEYLLSNDYKEAVPLLLSMKKEGYEISNVEYKLGLCYIHNPAKITLAINCLTEASKGMSADYNESDLAEKNAPFITLLYLADAYRLNTQISEAIHYYKAYALTVTPDDIVAKMTVEKRIHECYIAKILISHPITTKFSNPGALNQGKANYNACISGDGNILVFVRSMKFYEAVFMSKRLPNGWSTPEEITTQLGSDGDFYPTGLNHDGTKLLLTCFSLLSGNDIYESTYDKNKWSKVKKLTFQVSSDFNDIDAVYSSDDKNIYFSSNREGGKGGYDIYKSSKDDEGNWSYVENIGSPVNTASDERSPAFSGNGSMMVYSSNSGDGMGGFDLFYARKTNSGGFTESYNVGYPINTTDDDLGYKPLPTAGEGLISRFDPHGQGDLDLLFLKTDSFSNFKKVPLSGSLSINGDRSWSTPLHLYFVDKKTGDTIQEKAILSESYQTTLYPGDFVLSTSRKSSQTFSIPADTSMHMYKLVTVIVDPVNNVSDVQKSNTVIADTLYVNDILFDFNAYLISGKEGAKLKEIIQKLNKYQGVSVNITGYTDAIGFDGYNKKLAMQRALAVKKFFSSNGLSKAEIIAEGRGSINFVANNTNPDGSDNPDGRALNRRVELKVSVKSPVVIIIRGSAVK